MAETDAATTSKASESRWRWLRKDAANFRSLAWKVVLTSVAMGLFAMAAFFFLRIENGRNFLLCILLVTLGLALLLLAWVILVHGDLKQRTDGSVAVISSFALLALALEALRRYNLDFEISAECQERPTGQICSDSIAMTQHSQNAATLLQIWSLMVFGQIIPLLSILKDTLYCWLKPTPWQEISLAWADNRAIRRDNQRRTQQPDDTVEPETAATVE
ncbi:hypothetical protein [Arthrobacter dokdonensis]|uniref:hypothetical protein n=1 Tax=Arthrobacter dokdonellae TaxID=2211210 RepID=UPI001013CD81|nr:hypothetical protein [Arthrobacter dokdonellae]